MKCEQLSEAYGDEQHRSHGTQADKRPPRVSVTCEASSGLRCVHTPQAQIRPKVGHVERRLGDEF